MGKPQSARVISTLRNTLIIGAVLLAGLTGAVQAQTSTIRLLVGFPPGGGTDVIARTLAEKLKDQLGTSVIVENRAGAGGQIAAQALKAAPADGMTFFLTHDHTVSILPLVTKNPGFDPAKDFVAVAGFATFVNALAVSGGTPAKSMNEYVAWVRNTQNGKGNVGIPAPASVPEFLVKLIGEKYKLDLQAAPYRGSAPMIADMLGNQIGAGVGSIPDFIENHKAGKIRVVAVLGGARQAALPDVPTFAELGLSGFEDLPYYGIFAPAGTPKASIDRFAEAVSKVVAMPEVRDRLTAMGLTVGYMPPAQLASREHAYAQTWARIIKPAAFRPSNCSRARVARGTGLHARRRFVANSGDSPAACIDAQSGIPGPPAVAALHAHATCACNNAGTDAMQPSTDRQLIQVALVEDDVHFQNTIIAAIEASPDIRLTSMASTRAQGLHALAKPPADVLLVDLGLPDGSGVDVIRPRMRSGHLRRDGVHHLWRRGACTPVDRGRRIGLPA